jgi:colanic acid/amylovoran biosynthesis glycosyltransferase
MTLTPIRVGMVIDTFPSLSETFILNHITSLLDAGHEVTIFARRPPTAFPKVHPHVEQYNLMSRVRYMPNQAWSTRQILQVPYALARSVGRRGAARALNVARYGWGGLRFRALHALAVFKRENFDLLHCHYAAIGWAFASYGDIFDVPLVTSFHGDHYGSFGKDGGWLLSGLFRHSDAFVANSEFTKRELVHLGCAAEKVRVIPAMVTTDGTQFRTPDLRNRPLRLMTVARLHESKGVDVALRAVRILLDRGHDVIYQVIGDGPHRGQFETLTSQLGIQERVIFSGWMNQDEVYTQYRHADMFVLPSLLCANGANEAQGLVIQEAQLHGLPIVASNIGGVPESLDFGRAGKLFTAGDPISLADRVVEYIEDPKTASTMAQHAEQYVREKYTRGPVMDQLLGLYGELLSRRTRRQHVA